MKKWLTIEGTINLLIAFDNFSFLPKGNATKKKEREREEEKARRVNGTGKTREGKERKQSRHVNEGKEHTHICMCGDAFTRVLASISSARLIAELRAK